MVGWAIISAIVVVLACIATWFISKNVSVQQYKDNEEAKLEDAESKARVIIDDAFFSSVGLTFVPTVFRIRMLIYYNRPPTFRQGGL